MEQCYKMYSSAYHSSKLTWNNNCFKGICHRIRWQQGLMATFSVYGEIKASAPG